MNSKSGCFISFEGGDGSGKSTQIRILTDRLESKGFEVVRSREPGGTPIGEEIRKILLDPENKAMDAMTETMLYAAARAQLVAQVIRPALERGCVVICDRFLDSSIAYQGYGRGLGDAVKEINAWGIGDCVPDMTIYLQVDPETGGRRIDSRPKDRLEQETMDFHCRVDEGFRRLCQSDPERIIPIDAGRSIDAIADEIEKRVMEKIDEY